MAGAESKQKPGNGYSKLPGGAVPVCNVIKKGTVIVGHEGKETEKFTFFFGSGSPFSNWYLCKFTMPHPLDEKKSIVYNCSEQRMMHAKACEFGDLESAGKIMKSASPRTHKALGRKVKNYNEEQWRRLRIKIVREALIAKFEQNRPLMEALLKTEGCFVEASPYDKIWGIGLAANSPKAQNRATWKGTNLLGHILDDIRADFMKKGWAINAEGAAVRKV